MFRQRDIEVPFAIKRTQSSEEPHQNLPQVRILTIHEQYQSVPSQKFVCFSCQKDQCKFNSAAIGNRQQCPECKGSGFVQKNHPFVKLINDIFNKKFGYQMKKAAPRIQKSQHKNRYSNLSNQQLINNQIQIRSYRSIKSELKDLTEIIKEESSFFQDKQINCARCQEECQETRYSCSFCQNFNLCQKCYSHQVLTHQHPLRKVYISKTSSKTDSFSEQQKQDCSFNQIRGSRGRYCHKCTQNIDDCYWHCQTCKVGNKTFFVCKQCYDKEDFLHQKEHQLQLNFHTLNSSAYKDQDDQSMTQAFPIIEEQSNQCSPTNFQFSNLQKQFECEPVDIFQQILEQHCRDQAPISKANLKTFFSIDSQYEQNRNMSIRYENQPKKKSFNQSQVLMDLSCDSIGQMQKSQCSQSQFKNSPSHKNITFLENVRSIQCQRFQPLNPQHTNYYLFVGYQCDMCGISPIQNKKYHCLSCQDYDICQDCYNKKGATHCHDRFQVQDGNEVLEKQKQAKKSIIQNRVSFMNQRKSKVFQKLI